MEEDSNLLIKSIIFCIILYLAKVNQVLGTKHFMCTLKNWLWPWKGFEISLNTYPNLSNLHHHLYSGALKYWTTNFPKIKAMWNCFQKSILVLQAIFLICKINSYQKNNPIKKGAEDLSRQFPKEDLWMAKKHITRKGVQHHSWLEKCTSKPL